jgi:predicted O-methyltransferase YrrM
LPKQLHEFAYEDAPLPIEEGQTISQPYIVAFMTEALALHGVERVLEIGAGSGYAAAVLSRIAGEVYTVERIGQLAEKAASTLADLGYHNVHVRVIYRPETELASHYFQAILPDQFDEYIWFDETRAVAPFETKTLAEMPDTYPFGL